MSCGNPHQTPCTDVLHALVLFIDGELAKQKNEIAFVRISADGYELGDCRHEFSHKKTCGTRSQQCGWQRS